MSATLFITECRSVETSGGNLIVTLKSGSDEIAFAMSPHVYLSTIRDITLAHAEQASAASATVVKFPKKRRKAGKR